MLKKTALMVLSLMLITMNSGWASKKKKTPAKSDKASGQVNTMVLDETVRQLREKLKVSLDSEWEIRVEKFEGIIPFQWFGSKEKNSGIFVSVTKPKLKEKTLKPYSDYYQGEDKYTFVYPAFSRLLYFQIDCGYSYGMTERAHPDDVYALTRDFVIIESSQYAGNGNFKSDDVKKVFDDFFKIEDKSYEKYAVTVKNEIKDMNAFRKQNPGKKFAILNLGNDMRVSVRIINLY